MRKSLFRYSLGGILLLLTASCIPEEGNPDLSGTWTCTETSEIFLKGTKGTSIYQVTFTADQVVPDNYRISNFYKLGSNIRVTIIRSGYTINLHKQSVEGFLFEGAGEINDTYDIIQMAYTVDDGGGVIDHVMAEYAR